MNQSGTLKYGCVLIPLGSPRVVSKRSYVHVPGVPGTVVWCSAGHERGVPWVHTGWVYRVGNTGYYPATQPLGPSCSRSKPTSEAGPGSPRGLEWVGGCSGRPGTVSWHGARPAPRYHPSGPVSPCRGLPVPGTLPTGKRARFHHISWKVSQNHEVSPNNVEKACHSP